MFICGNMFFHITDAGMRDVEITFTVVMLNNNNFTVVGFETGYRFSFKKTGYRTQCFLWTLTDFPSSGHVISKKFELNKTVYNQLRLYIIELRFYSYSTSCDSNLW